MQLSAPVFRSYLLCSPCSMILGLVPRAFCRPLCTGAQAASPRAAVSPRTFSPACTASSAHTGDAEQNHSANLPALIAALSAASKQQPPAAGTLHLVSTPIGESCRDLSECTVENSKPPSKPIQVSLPPTGNREDITLRALRVLQQVSCIYAEDTRHSSQLLRHYGINTPLVSLHEHNEYNRTEQASELGACVPFIYCLQCC